MMMRTCSGAQGRISMVTILIGTLLVTIVAAEEAQAAPATTTTTPVDPFPTPMMLAKCMQRGVVKQGGLKPPLNWETAMKDGMGDVQVNAIMWSAKESDLPVTVVTQLSLSRLPQLYAQCVGWSGPLSAVVYVPLLERDHGKKHHLVDETFTDFESMDMENDVDADAEVDLRETNAIKRRARAVRAAQKYAQSVWNMSRDMVNRFARLPTRQLARDPIPSTIGIPKYTYLRASQLTNLEYDESSLSRMNQEVLAKARQAIATMFVALERQPSACSMEIVLAFEVVADLRVANLLYPVNQLRNLARLQARTELIAQLDVDMLVSNQLAVWLKEGNNAETMVEACRNKNVFVLPAFEAHKAETDIAASAKFSDQVIRLTKAELEKVVESMAVVHFDYERFPQGHNTTDFPRWFRSSEPYHIPYTYRYEPWVVLHRIKAPWHDVRFRGYGNNKIQQIYHLNVTGYKFQVHPAGFLIHRAHPFTDARKQLIQDLVAYKKSIKNVEPTKIVVPNDFKETLYGYTKLLFESLQVEMDNGKFQPLIDMPAKHCSRMLPWMSPTWSPPTVASTNT